MLLCANKLNHFVENPQILLTTSAIIVYNFPAEIFHARCVGVRDNSLDCREKKYYRVRILRGKYGLCWDKGCKY